MPKDHCTSRAEWRLQLGKPAERLSAHYRLDCDYGTAIVICWQEGGSEPIYLCEGHTKELEPAGENHPGVRTVTAQSAHGDIPAKSADRTETPEVPDTKPNGSASSEAIGSPSDAKLGRALKDPSVRSPVRDLTYGNPAKALVDEAIWNMATGDCEAYRTALRQGKPAAEAARAAGGQLAMIHRKISDYTLKLEAALSESRATINVGEVIDKPLEHAVLEIISNGTMSDFEKDAAIQQLGALQEWVKHDLQGEITPLEANRILRTIGDRVNWGGSTAVSEQLKPAYRELYDSLKSALRAAVPEAQNLHERLTNLYAAKSDLENSLTAKELNPITA